MFIVHIIEYNHHYCKLKYWINPREIDKTTGKKNYRAPVVREEIGVFHQRQTALAEVITKFLRHIVETSVTVDEVSLECLESRSHAFLCSAVFSIVGEEEHSHPILFRTIFVSHSFLRLIGIEL